jgi:hypothetical protein
MSEEKYATATLELRRRVRAVVGRPFDLADYTLLARGVKEAGVRPGELYLRSEGDRSHDLTSIFDLAAGCLDAGLEVQLEGAAQHQDLLVRVQKYVQSSGQERYEGLSHAA